MTAILTFVKRCLLLGILFFALLGFQGKAGATYDYYFFDDFESCSAPGDLYNCNNYWTKYDGNSAEVYSSGTGAYSGTNYVAGNRGNIIEFPPLENGAVSFFALLNSETHAFFIGNKNSTNDSWPNSAGIMTDSIACDTENQFYKYNLAEEYGYSALPVETTCRSDIWQKWTMEWRKNESRLEIRVGHNGFFTDWNVMPVAWSNITHFAIMTGSAYSAGSSTYIDDIKITSPAEVELSEVPYYWSDWCGNDAGKFLETTPTDLCDIGNASAVVFDGVKWSWDCVDGVVSQNCRSYISTTLPVDGVCGTWAGETFDVWPAKTQLCEPSASLIEGTMTETINGWSWGCAGFNGGSNSVCFADKGVGTLPVYPELPAGTIDDCDGLPLLEGLVCKIGNTIKQIFLPSSEKLNELNQTINKIATKFPFSYISIATDTIKEVGVKINETSDFEMSLLGSEKKSIDFNRIPFAEHIKGFTTTLFILFFLFWLVRYIRNVF